jgi:hypothetical protein
MIMETCIIPPANKLKSSPFLTVFGAIKNVLFVDFLDRGDIINMKRSSGRYFMFFSELKETQR